MKIGFKRVLIGLLTLIVLALAGVAVFLTTLDPNTYKSKIQDWAYEHYQRTLTIDGDLQLSLFPRIALAAQDVHLSDRESDAPFVSVESARFAVAIWPLLFDRFVVDHVSVSGFKATLVRHKDGGFNFDDLLGRGEAVPPAATSAAPPVEGSGPVAAPASNAGGALNVDIAGLELKEGQILFSDEQTGQSVSLVNLQVNTGRMTFGQPFDVTLSAALKGESPVADASVSGQAQVKLDPQQRSYSAQRLTLQVAGQLADLQAQALSVRGNLAYDGASRMLDASQLEWRLEGSLAGEQPIEGLDISLTVPKFKVDRSRLEFATEKLALRARASLPGSAPRDIELAIEAPQLSISPEQAGGQPVQATFKQTGERTLGVSMRLEGLGGHARQLSLKSAQLDAQFKKGDQLTQIVLASPVEWDVSNDKAIFSAIKGDVRINDAYLPSGSFEFPFIGSMHVGAAGMNGDINAVLSGTPLNFSLSAEQWDKLRWQFALQADAVDLDKLFPPVPAGAAVSKPPAEAEPPAAPQTEQTAQVAQEGESTEAPAAATPAAPAAEAPAPEAAPAAPQQTADFRWLQGLDLGGKVDIGLLKGRGIEAQQVKANLKAKDGELVIDGVSAQLYGGSLTGRFSVDAQSALGLKLSMKGVEAEPFSRLAGLSYPLTGKATLDTDLQTKGSGAERLKQLNGKLRLRVQPGAIQGIDVERTLSDLGQAVQSALAGRRVQLESPLKHGGQTPFTSLVIDTNIKQGVVDLRQVALQSPLFQLSQGKPARIDLVQSRIDTLLDVRVTGTLKSQDGRRAVNLRGVTVPVLISGALMQPTYRVEWNKMGGKVVEQALKRGLLEILGGEAAVPMAQPAATTAGPAETEQTLRGLGNALKNILRP